MFSFSFRSAQQDRGSELSGCENVEEVDPRLLAIAFRDPSA